jgi:hypothetical protein
MIFIARKQGKTVSFRFTAIPSLKAPYPDVLAAIGRFGVTVPGDCLEGESWNLSTREAVEVHATVRRTGRRLRDLTSSPILRGLTTGLNEAFVINGSARARFLALDPHNADLIKPLLGGRDIRRWSTPSTGKWVIVTPIGVNIRRYPAIFEHLRQWQDALERRCDKGEFWWELRPCSYYEVFEKPKIICTKVSIRSAFSMDTDGRYLTNTAYMLEINDYREATYLLGILNSETIWSFLKTASVTIGNTDHRGRVEPRVEDIMNIPIPEASADDVSAISLLAQRCIDGGGIGCEAWEQEINERVASLYGL